MLKKLIALFAVAGYVLVLAGCHTLEGAGKDVEALGEGVQDIADTDDK